MSTIEERIERARLEREAQERRAARRSHPGAEDSTPPVSEEWPPRPVQGRPGDGNPHLNVDAVHKTVAPVWAILGIIGTCLAVGFGGAIFLGGVAKKDTVETIKSELVDMKRTQAVNQAVIELTLTQQGKDIAAIRDALHVAQTPEPIKPEKPHR